MHSFIELAYKLINIVQRFWVCLYIPSDKGMWYFGAVYMHEYASWEICMQVRKQQLELDTEQQTGSK